MLPKSIPKEPKGLLGAKLLAPFAFVDIASPITEPSTPPTTAPSTPPLLAPAAAPAIAPKLLNGFLLTDAVSDDKGLDCPVAAGIVTPGEPIGFPRARNCFIENSF